MHDEGSNLALGEQMAEFFGTASGIDEYEPLFTWMQALYDSCGILHRTDVVES